MGGILALGGLADWALSSKETLVIWGWESLEWESAWREGELKLGL
jgi:hypothetical protein